jgi:exosortase
MGTVNTIAADAGRSVLAPSVGEDGQVKPSRARLWSLLATTLVLGFAYAPNFADLYSIWTSDPNYSHGPLVIPIAVVIGVILWRRLPSAEKSKIVNAVPTPYWGWALLLVVLVIRAISYEQNARWSETATLVPAVVSLTWIFGGWPLLRRIWPAIAFLVFMLPLPNSVNNLLAMPLQGVATVGSCFLLQLSGIWIVQAGNTIRLTTPHGVERLEVAAACNGLSMLMTLAATVTATIILIPLPTWKRITVLASAIPIALVSNMLRIVATGWCYYLISGPVAKHWAHDVSGWLMMPLGLLLVGLELGILSWLVPDDTEPGEDDDKAILPVLTGLSERKK